MYERYDLIIIGAGPAGIAAAVEASIMKVGRVLLLEKGDNHSTTIRNFYKDNKRVDKDWNNQKVEFDGHVEFFDGTKESTIAYFDQLLATHAIEAHFNEEVEKVLRTQDGLKVITPRGHYRGNNVIVAIGRMGKPNKPSYPIPPSVRSRVHYNLDACSSGEKILVVGGGNSAAEYAIDLADTNDVTLCYRQRAFTRLNAQNLLNLDRAVSHGKIRQLLGVNILGLEEGEKGQVRVLFDQMGAESFDRIIYAIGGTTPEGFLQACGITLDDNKNPVMDSFYQTNIPGLYISGDLALPRGGSIGIALNISYKIVSHILTMRR
ncbi:MAG: NAD(P)-binding domain-containing protein [Campylobacterales bacterium]